MKVNLTLDVDDHMRYVIAKFFAPAAKGLDKRRRRATRAQVRRFVQAAARRAVVDHARDLPARMRATATRLSKGVPAREVLPPPREEQRELQWR